MSKTEIVFWCVSIWFGFGATFAIARRLDRIARILMAFGEDAVSWLKAIHTHTGYMRDASRDFEVRDRARAAPKALALKGWQCPCCSYAFTVPDDSGLAIVVFQWNSGRIAHQSICVAAGTFTREIHTLDDTGCEHRRWGK